jgi:predicted PurR-regulated permease PerM
MVDRDRLHGGLYALVPRKHHMRLSHVLIKLELIVGGYIRGQLLTSGLMAAFTEEAAAIALEITKRRRAGNEA